MFWAFSRHLGDVARDSVEAAYLGGFKDGFLLAAAVFSILLVLFRHGE
jgi:hypothetical protein